MSSIASSNREAASAVVAVPIERGLFGQPEMLFQSHYVWFVFLSALDLLFTSIILKNGGIEMNWIANAVIESHGSSGLLVFKFSLVVLIIITIEQIGRSKIGTGRAVARLAIVITSFPVIVGFTQVAYLSYMTTFLG